jgi:hypothetical protein
MNSDVILRVAAIGLVVYWVVQLVLTARKPRTWRVPRSEEYGIPLSRNGWLVSCILGISAGLMIFALSFVLFP